MDVTPSKSPRTRRLPTTSTHSPRAAAASIKIRKPPPITPRRFTRFFTPRLRQPSNAIKTSRTALRSISGAALNVRNSHRAKLAIDSSVGENSTSRGKKRKLSFVLAEVSATSSPTSQLVYGEDLIRSSPTIPERQTPIRIQHDADDLCDTEDETDIDEDVESENENGTIPAQPHRILPYNSKTIAGGFLSSRLLASRRRKETLSSHLWQEETGHFCTGNDDENAEFTNAETSSVLPFSAAACHTNSLVAIGDEEGRIRLLDTSSGAQHGMTRAWLTMIPHDNAIMDLEFSQDDTLLATASGDQSCQVIDVQTQTSLWLLGDHRCSVKKIAFQPGSGNQVLASCGRDGQVNFWDLRCNTMKYPSVRGAPATMEMTNEIRRIAPTHMIRDAHTAGHKSKPISHRSKPNLVPGRSDFSITSLSFLGDTRPHLLVTASEIDSVIKLWDIRTSYGASRRAPNPVSITPAPQSHAQHRSFGITSMALNTDGSRLYSLSRDHTVYAYATSHLILGSSPQLSQNSKPSKSVDSHEGLQPLYGLRHPNMRIQTFWPRLAIRKATDSCSELLAVGSSDDCAVLFPTNEKYMTSSTMNVPALHLRAREEARIARANEAPARPVLGRSSSSLSFTQRLSATLDCDDSLRIYRHGTPLVRGHCKEVTSLTWSSEGHLVTTSDDYSVRCWREQPEQARFLRTAGEHSGARWRSGWSDVGVPGFDEEY